MRQSKVSVRGQTVIPQEIRQRFAIKANTKLVWSARNGVIVVVPVPEDPVEASFGILKGTGFTFEDFMEDRRRERELDRLRDERLMRQLDESLGQHGED